MNDHTASRCGCCDLLCVERISCHPLDAVILRADREADIAVRMAPPLQKQLVARRLGRIEVGLHASAAYLARQGIPESIDDLLTHALIGFDQSTPLIRKALKPYPQFQRDVFSMRTYSDLAQLNLIRASAGIGICQVQLADGGIPLQRVLPDFFSLHLETWVVMHEDLRHSPCCKRVFDMLAEGLQEYIHRRINGKLFV